MSLITELLNEDRFRCEKPVLILPDLNKKEDFVPIETPFEYPDPNEKSRLVTAFNTSHAKPGFKVSR